MLMEIGDNRKILGPKNNECLKEQRKAYTQTLWAYGFK